VEFSCLPNFEKGARAAVQKQSYLKLSDLKKVKKMKINRHRSAGVDRSGSNRDLLR